MANTRDVIGEKATLAGIVGNTLTNLEEDGVTVLASSALKYRSSLVSVRFPNATKIMDNAFVNCTELTEITASDLPNVAEISSYAFRNCANLISVRLPKVTSIGSQAFYNCQRLCHVILESSTLVSSVSNSFEKTPIMIGDGGVYVPSNLVTTYKANSKWSAYNIYPISEYPRSSFDSISDSWDTIISYANAGTIGDHYAVGDTKKVTIDGVDYYAQLVGINKDTLSSDGTTKANSTWLLKNLLTTISNGQCNAAMNSTTTTVGGWAESDMRKYTLPAILQTFPANLQSAIKSVNKVSYRFEDTSEQITADKLWIPSSQEVNLTGNYLMETTGVVYDGVFTDNNSRKRYYKNCNEFYYKLRSAYSSTNFVDIAYGGSGNSNQASTASGILLGFCI